MVGVVRAAGFRVSGNVRLDVRLDVGRVGDRIGHGHVRPSALSTGSPPIPYWMTCGRFSMVIVDLAGIHPS